MVATISFGDIMKIEAIPEIDEAVEILQSVLTGMVSLDRHLTEKGFELIRPMLDVSWDLVEKGLITEKEYAILLIRDAFGVKLKCGCPACETQAK